MSHPSYLVYKDYLPEDANAALLQHAVENETVFHSSKIHYDKRKEAGESISNPKMENWRRSHFTHKKSFEHFYALLSNRILLMYPDICEKLSITAFDVDDIEMQMTSHNDGDFYKPHVDNGSGDATQRVITFVYYFHSIPKQFTGGQLLIFRPTPSIVEPNNNSIVFFNSSLQHAVHPIQCGSKLFEHSRFTLNGWIRKKVVESETIN